MAKRAEQLKRGTDQALESLSHGWRELGARASSALTRLSPSTVEPSTERARARPQNVLPRVTGWAFMAADVFDTADEGIVRIEAPAMRREDFNVELNGDLLTVWGEKRIDREATDGRWRVAQCA